MHPYNRAYWKSVVAGGAASLLVFICSMVFRELVGFWRIAILGSLLLVCFAIILVLLGIDAEDKDAFHTVFHAERLS
jgi:hypothetical membrane protein